MTDALLSLRGEGIPVFSLLEVFAGIEETLYSDSIHLMRDARGESPGYRLMAEKIAHTLAEAWTLRGRRSLGPGINPALTSQAGIPNR
jgi:hypothetical protein